MGLLWDIDSIRQKLEGLVQPNGTAMEFERHSTTAKKKILLVKAQRLTRTPGGTARAHGASIYTAGERAAGGALEVMSSLGEGTTIKATVRLERHA